MNCLHCNLLGLKAYPRHAALGLGLCGGRPGQFVFMDFIGSRECNKYVPAPADVVAARVEWWSKREKEK